MEVGYCSWCLDSILLVLPKEADTVPDYDMRGGGHCCNQSEQPIVNT